MELREDKISFADIKQYLSLLINDIDEIGKLEFKTYKGWWIYSLSLVILFCTPCVIILLITGFLSGNMPYELLVSVSFLPFMFGLPLVLLLTYINNYRKPKLLRKLMLDVLERYDWDEPIKQVEQAQFECIKNDYVFRTGIYQEKDKSGREKLLICMIIPYYLPVTPGKEEEYIKNIDAYLDGKCIFLIQSDMAYFGVPVKLFPKLDLHNDIEQLLYVVQRFSLHPCTLYSYKDIVTKVPVTCEILALTVFGEDIINQRWVEWANDMLKAGFINKTMKCLASGAFPDNQTDLKERVNVLIREFNMEQTNEEILSNYIWFLLMEQDRGKRSVLEVVQCLDDLYLLSGIPELYDYHLLFNAKTALIGSGKQNFWVNYELSVDNVDSYILSNLYRLLENKLTSRTK